MQACSGSVCLHVLSSKCSVKPLSYPSPPRPLLQAILESGYQHPFQNPTKARHGSCELTDFTFPAWSAAFAPVLASLTTILSCLRYFASQTSYYIPAQCGNAPAPMLSKYARRACVLSHVARLDI